MSPAIKPIENLPANLLLIIPSIDILLHEELTFVERVKKEIRDAGLENERAVEGVTFEKAFHGWFECEQCIIVTLFTIELTHL